MSNRVGLGLRAALFLGVILGLPLMPMQALAWISPGAVAGDGVPDLIFNVDTGETYLSSDGGFIYLYFVISDGNLFSGEPNFVPLPSDTGFDSQTIYQQFSSGYDFYGQWNLGNLFGESVPDWHTFLLDLTVSIGGSHSGFPLPGAILQRSGLLHYESNDGDFSNDPFGPTALTLAPGTNAVMGTVSAGPGLTDDNDYFSVTIPTGQVLGSIELNGLAQWERVYGSLSPNGGLIYLNMSQGAVYDPENLMGIVEISTHDLHANLLQQAFNVTYNPNAPLPAGTYTFWVDGFRENTTYEFDFQTWLVADSDGDGDVDTADLTTMFQNFTGAGVTGKSWAEGDIDGDGDVDTADITAGLQNFTGSHTTGLSGLSTTQPVPEPSSLLICLLGLGTCLLGRRLTG